MIALSGSEKAKDGLGVVGPSIRNLRIMTIKD